MKQIIRSIAVETPSQRNNLERQHSELHSRQASIAESSVLSPKVNLSVLPKSSDIVIKNNSNKSTSCENKALSALLYVVWEKKLDILPRVVMWECTGNTAQVSHIPEKQITTWMTRTLGKMKAKAEQATPSTLVLKVSLWKFLPNIRKTTQLAVKIAKTKTWLHSIWMQRTQQSSFSNSFFTLSYGKC
ncbi:MAG: hypothetical protein RLZZ507_1874 [Cyanobacteriota bacterium]|jgi:hypothetical protein